MRIKPFYLILAIVCLIYSVSIYMVGSGTMSFAIWIAGAVFFMLLFHLSGNERRKRIPELTRRVLYVLLSIILAVSTLCMIAMITHFNDRGDDNLDYIIVLGAQMREDGPSAIFRYRLDAAYEYLQDNPGTICIVSGAKGANEATSEGEGGKEYLVLRGIAPEKIVAETEAVNTEENLVLSERIINEQCSGLPHAPRIGVVTNNYHVFRGVHLAKRCFDGEVFGIAAYTVPWYLPNNMVRECFGIIKDFRKMSFLE